MIVSASRYTSAVARYLHYSTTLAVFLPPVPGFSNRFSGRFRRFKSDPTS